MQSDLFNTSFYFKEIFFYTEKKIFIQLFFHAFGKTNLLELETVSFIINYLINNKLTIIHFNYVLSGNGLRKTFLFASCFTKKIFIQHIRVVEYLRVVMTMHLAFLLLNLQLMTELESQWDQVTVRNFRSLEQYKIPNRKYCNKITEKLKVMQNI